MPDMIDKWSFVVMIATLIFGWILFWNYSNQMIFSFLAAVLAAAMMWLAYIVMRVIILAIWRP